MHTFQISFSLFLRWWTIDCVDRLSQLQTHWGHEGAFWEMGRVYRLEKIRGPGCRWQKEIWRRKSVYRYWMFLYICSSFNAPPRPAGLGAQHHKKFNTNYILLLYCGREVDSLVSQCESISIKHCDFLLNSTCTRSSMTYLQEKGGELELNIEMTYWNNQHNESIDTIRYN